MNFDREIPVGKIILYIIKRKLLKRKQAFPNLHNPGKNNQDTEDSHVNNSKSGLSSIPNEIIKKTSINSITKKLSIFSEAPIPLNNIEIKEIPDNSMFHGESATNHVPNVALQGEVKKEDGSFMSDQKYQNNIQVERIYPGNEENKHPTAQQTDSTMNIKSFSNLESQRDSVQFENIRSPGGEITDMNIPLNQNFMEEHPMNNNIQFPEIDQTDFEKEYYKTREELRQQSEAVEHHMYVQSHNSTMLMESVQDHQGSQIWGSSN